MTDLGKCFLVLIVHRANILIEARNAVHGAKPARYSGRLKIEKRRTMTILYRGVILMLILSASAPVYALHVPSHGLPSQPSQQQVEEFCDKYPDLIQSPNLSPQQKDGYEQAYKQHCKKKSSEKPAASSTLQGRIDRIDTPDCLAPGTEIRVEGEALQQGELACGLESKGRRTALHALSKTDRQFRYRLDGALSRLPGPDFRVECKVKGDEKAESVSMCTSGTVTGPGTDAEEPAGEVDLVPEIQAGALQPGRTQVVEVEVRNLGRSESKHQRHRLMLVLTTRDLARAVRLTTTLSPASGEVLAETHQWLTRIPGANQSETVAAAMSVPEQVPQGSLFWCAMVDSDHNISEFNERNNVLCRPASDDSQSVGRDDLSKLFGRAARQQMPKLEPQFDPGEESGFPQGATLTTLRSTLKVNNSFFSVSVPGGGPMTVSWEDLPETIDGDPVVGLLIRFRRNTGFAEDDCLSDPDRWDDLPVDESVIQNPAWPPADRPFHVDLSQTDSSGDRIFFSGRTYFIKGCIQVEQDGAAAFAEETNTVEVLYDSYVTVTEMGMTLTPPTSPRIGLAISLDGATPSAGPAVSGPHSHPARRVWDFTVHYDLSEITDGLATARGEFVPLYAALGYSEIAYRACDMSASDSGSLYEVMVSLSGRDPDNWIRPGTTGTVELTNAELRPYRDFYVRLCARGMRDGRETFFVSNQIRINVQDRTFTPLDLTVEDIQKSGRQTLIVARAELFADYPYPEGTSEWHRRLPTIAVQLKDYSSRERLGGATVDYRGWSEISENVWKVWLLVDYGVPNGYRRHLLAELSSPWLDRYPDNNWLDKFVGSGRRYTEPAVAGSVSHPSDLRDLEITYRDDTLLNFRFMLDVSSQTRKLVIDVDPPGELAKMVCREDHTDGSSYAGTSYTTYIENGIRIATRVSFEYTVRCRRLARYHGEGRIFIRAYDRVRAGERADAHVDELIVDYRIAPP